MPPLTTKRPVSIVFLQSRQDELVEVLKANHLASAKAVAKKAQTIMRQADADGSGTLTLDEFLVVAKKFPNLVRDFETKPKTWNCGLLLIDDSTIPAESFGHTWGVIKQCSHAVDANLLQ